MTTTKIRQQAGKEKIMRSILVSVFLTVLTAAPALAEQVNFTVTPGPGQSVTQIKIEPICATCTAVVQPAPVPTPEPPKPDKPRLPAQAGKPKVAKKPSCDCAGLTAERDACNTAREQIESAFAAAAAERDSLARQLADCNAARGEGDQRIEQRDERIEELYNEVKACNAKSAEPAPASPPPAADKPQGRGSSRGRRDAAPAAVAPPPAAPPQGQEEDFSPIRIRGKLTTP